jgi:multidrug efflux pump
MSISELSIRRPVFATVLALLLLIIGVMSALRLSDPEYPDISQPVVSINVNYRGANAAVIETRVTQVIENEVAGLEGVDKLTSQSRDELASINVQFNADRDMDAAANDVRDRVTRIMARLPEEADPPQIQKVDSGSDAVLIAILSSTRRNSLELTDYADRYLVDRLGSVPGVASVNMNGAGRYAMRVWLDRTAMAARQIAVTDLEAALRSENVELPAGRIESRSASSRCAPTPRCAPRRISAAWWSGAGPTATWCGSARCRRPCSWPPRTSAAIARANDGPALSCLGSAASKANVLEVSEAIKRRNGPHQPTLPEGHQDGGQHRQHGVRPRVDEEGRGRIAGRDACLIVLVVIFVFLGTLRATLIPAVTIPVSIIAAALVMAASATRSTP